MLRLLFSISIWSIAQFSSAQEQNFQVYGEIINDSLVSCSVFQLIDGDPVLLYKTILDENYYHATLDFNKTYSIVFEGTESNKFIYVSPVSSKLLHLNVNFDTNESDKIHCFIVYNKKEDDYKLHKLNQEELDDAQKKFQLDKKNVFQL